MAGGGIEPAQMDGARVAAPGMDGSLVSTLVWGVSGLGIAAKEAIPVVLAAFSWGYQWQGKPVFEADNSTVVAALRSGSCRDAEVMRLL